MTKSMYVRIKIVTLGKKMHWKEVLMTQILWWMWEWIHCTV